MADKPKVVVTRRLTDAVHARLQASYSVDLNLQDRVYSAAELIDRCRDADAVIPCHSEHFTADVIAQLPSRLKVIANHSVGVDHVDLEAARNRGIIVTNTPDVLSAATAEIAMLCLLGAARRGAEGDRLVRQNRWDFWSPAFMVGVEVSGKSLGIVGMGRVGQVMARRARGFDMQVHYHARNRVAAETEAGAVYHARLEDMLPQVDIVSLHCPATPQTTGLMDRRMFALMRDGAILVNTARGALVEEAALVEVLRSGKLFAAGLDVYVDEPGGNPDLAGLDNTFLLPHIGSATRETRDAMGFRAIDNIDAVFAGAAPGDRVA